MYVSVECHVMLENINYIPVFFPSTVECIHSVYMWKCIIYMKKSKNWFLFDILLLSYYTTKTNLNLRSLPKTPNIYKKIWWEQDCCSKDSISMSSFYLAQKSQLLVHVILAYFLRVLSGHLFRDNFVYSRVSQQCRGTFHLSF